jgi:hypothetical protein
VFQNPKAIIAPGRAMKPLLASLILLSAHSFGLAADTNAFKDPELEKLYQRFVREMKAAQSNLPADERITNFDTPFMREDFKRTVVHPSFGLRWDEVPAPSMTNINAMAEVDAFVATNGWNMETNNCAFDCMEKRHQIQSHPRFTLDRHS